MRSGAQGFTIIEIIAVLVVVGLLAAIAVPKYYDLREEARMKAAAAAVAEAQARINLAFARYVLAGHPCTKLRSVQMREAPEGEEMPDALFIGDGWGNVGGWGFVVHPDKTLITFGSTMEIEAVVDPEGRKIDVSKAGLFLHFPQCGAAEKHGS